MPCGIRILERVVDGVAVSVEALRIARIRYNGVGTEEAVKIRVIISGVIKVQAKGTVVTLPGVLEAGGRGGVGRPARAAPGSVALFGVQRPIAVRRDGGAAQVVAEVHVKKLYVY